MTWEHKDIINFEVIDADIELPIQDISVIAFVPSQGFQMCKYYNGSKTWQSLITRMQVKVSIWLKVKE